MADIEQIRIDVALAQLAKEVLQSENPEKLSDKAVDSLLYLQRCYPDDSNEEILGRAIQANWTEQDIQDIQDRVQSDEYDDGDYGDEE